VTGAGRSAALLSALVAVAVLAPAGSGAARSASAPVPIGRAAGIGAHWRLRVLWRKEGQRKHVPGIGTLPPGVIETDLVRVRLTYLGSGTGQVLPVIDNLKALGKRHEIYGADGGCNPPAGTDFPDNGYGSIRSGRSANGTLCLVVDARDAQSLELYALSPATTSLPTYPPPASVVWFALR